MLKLFTCAYNCVSCTGSGGGEKADSIRKSKIVGNITTNIKWNHGQSLEKNRKMEDNLVIWWSLVK